jgi:transcription termination/antitermination protein NusA
LDPNLRVILQQLEAEKSIDRHTLLEAIRSAIESAARKSMAPTANVVVDVDPDTLEFKVSEIRDVVEEVEDPACQLNIEEARQLNPNVKLGNRLKMRAQPTDFGRIAAQTAKQVIIQKIKDAERDKVFDEFKQREGELVTGTVKRATHGNVIVTIGRAEAVLPYREQSPRENFKPGERIRAYLREVDKNARGAQVTLSRTAPELVRGLFELEVPEIYDGTVEIRAIAREAGSRTKVAVHSNDGNVDPVGACVGMKGSRVRAVVEELCGEKIDIVRWSSNPLELCASALNPADILDIEMDEEKGAIHVMVPQDQLSLAIGKRGQNARLASKLIGWNIDIRGDVETGMAIYADQEDVSLVNESLPEDSESSSEGKEDTDTPKASSEDAADNNQAAPEAPEEEHAPVQAAGSQEDNEEQGMDDTGPRE